jgi:hypothetical protein
VHDSFDQPPEDDQNIFQSWSVIALPLLIVIALVGMVVSHPSAVKWVSVTAQAESVGPDFVGPDIVPDSPRSSNSRAARRSSSEITMFDSVSWVPSVASASR